MKLQFLIIACLLNLPLILSSCGFKPIYKSNTNIENGENYAKELAAIQIKYKRKRINQELRNNLQKILNPNDIKVKPKYLLNVDIDKGLVSTFTTTTGSSGRNKVVLTASYVLKDLNNGEKIASGDTNAKDDFDVEEKRFANYVIEEAIASNLTLTIAQNIRNLLINDIIDNIRKKKEEENEKLEDSKIDKSIKSDWGAGSLNN
jgi:hypothetical protein